MHLHTDHTHRDGIEPFRIDVCTILQQAQQPGPSQPRKVYMKCCHQIRVSSRFVASISESSVQLLIN